MNIIRQGDVLLVKVDAIPQDATHEQPPGDVILAYGEVTGHAHRIKDAANVQVWSAGAERFIRALETVALTHEEHTAVVLEKGATYRQIFQVEERGEEVRRVAD